MENVSRRQRPTSVHIQDLADELLELVLLRVSSPRCLIRAAAACRPWRRVIADGGFLRRFRSLHAPLSLGLFYAGVKTFFIPSATMPPGNNLAEFLTSAPNYMGRHLDLIDYRGGLLAFVATVYRLVVCDPWTRQYRDVHLPQTLVVNRPYRLGIFLLDNDIDAVADDDEMATTKMHMSNFRLLHVHMVHNNGRLTAMAFVFSAREGRWLWLSSGDIGDLIMADHLTYFEFVGHARCSFLWRSYEFSKILHLDVATREFSSFTLPEDPVSKAGSWNLHVVGKDTHGVLRLVRVSGGGDLEVLKLAHAGRQCLVERRASLNQLVGIESGPPCRCWWRVVKPAAGATGGHVALLQNNKELMFFDVETMELKRLQKIDYHADRLFPYEMPWPPTIKAGV